MNCQPISTVYRNRRFKHTVADLLSRAVNKKIVYDIIISGGGMIGASLACVLSRNPLLKDQKILLIEGAKKKDWVLGENYSNRVSALNPSTKRLLESVGIWKHIADARFKPVKQMKIWGSGSEAVVEFDKTESENVTYIVENDVLLAAVDKELEESSDTVSVTYGTKVQHYDLPLNSNGLVSLLMDDGISHSCSLLLGTDGANSQVRESMGVEYIKWNYGQSAIVATLELEQMPSNDIAWQRFLSTGPVALLPLTDSLSSLVWSTTTDNAKQLLKLSGEDFVKALNNVLTEPSQRNSLVDFTSQIASLVSNNLKIPLAANTPVPIPPTVTAVQDGSRAAFPLGFGHSSSYVRPGVAILGDAAHRVHPLAGQGVNLGFGDIECLNRVLGEAVLNGKVINSFSTLKQYEKERLRRNLPTMIAIDAINKIYSNSNTVITAFGHFAMQFANSFAPIKTLMVKQASS